MLLDNIMPAKIVLDLETKKRFDEVEGRNPEKLGVSLIVIYDYSQQTYKSFRENELKSLWPLLESADLIIGFNHKNFDNKVLSAYYGGDLGTLPNLDLLEEFSKAAGFRIRLDNLAEATLGEKKSSYGLQAIQWYEQGNFQALEEYCRHDVRLTKGLYEYALQYGKLKYKELSDLKEVVLDISKWDKIIGRAVNFTLPF
jgi:DEAD/DEAH box helicase domain-containing protein